MQHQGLVHRVVPGRENLQGLCLKVEHSKDQDPGNVDQLIEVVSLEVDWGVQHADGGGLRMEVDVHHLVRIRTKDEAVEVADERLVDQGAVGDGGLLLIRISLLKGDAGDVGVGVRGAHNRLPVGRALLVGVSAPVVPVDTTRHLIGGYQDLLPSSSRHAVATHEVVDVD